MKPPWLAECVEGDRSVAPLGSCDTMDRGGGDRRWPNARGLRAQWPCTLGRPRLLGGNHLAGIRDGCLRAFAAGRAVGLVQATAASVRRSQVPAETGRGEEEVEGQPESARWVQQEAKEVWE